MQAIFISYRRDDTEGHAQTLFKDLAREFGAGAVFMDVAGISPGLDFRKVIDQHTSSCCVLLAIIGKHWASAVDAAGRSRLADPNDFVRLETASALKRDIAVIPVLVHNAQMPRPEQLPADLQELVFRNNVELTHARWDSDVQVLIKSLRPIFDRANPTALPVPAPPSLPAPLPPLPAPDDDVRRRQRIVWAAGVAVAAAVAVGGGFVFVERQQAEAVRLEEAARQQAETDRRAAQAQQAASAAAARAVEQAAAKERARVVAAEQATQNAAARATEKAAEKAASDEAERSRLAAVDEAQRKAAGEALAARQQRDAAAAEASRQARERAVAEEVRLRQQAKLAGTCLVGYVWREARAGDKVCVTPAVRSEASRENSLASARRDPAGGPYGPDTCRQGYVWREAFAGDRVCVIPASRTRSADDNAKASQRVVR